MKHYFYRFIIAGALLGVPAMIMPMEYSSSSDDEAAGEECAVCFERKVPNQFRKLPNCKHQFCTTCCFEKLPKALHLECPICRNPWTVAQLAKSNQPAAYSTQANQSASITWNQRVTSRRNYAPFYVAGSLAVVAGIGYGAYKLYNYLMAPKRIQVPDLKTSTKNVPKEVLVKSVRPAAQSNRGPYNKRQIRKVK